MQQRLFTSIFLLAFCMAAAGQSSPPAAEVAGIIRELKSDVRAKSHELRWDLAERIATRQGREAIDPLVDVMLNAGPYSIEQIFAITAIVEIADGDDQRGLKSALKQSRGFPDPVGLAAAALSTFERPVAQAQFLKMLAAGARQGENVAPPESSSYACGFLRMYQSEELRSALLNSPPRQQGEVPFRALVASLDYSEQLQDAKSRESYLDFERALWRAYATAHKGSRKVTEFNAAASSMVVDLGHVDERFLMRIFDDASGTEIELRIAFALAVQLATDSLQEKLRSLATGDSPYRAAMAKQALQQIERRNRPPSTTQSGDK